MGFYRMITKVDPTSLSPFIKIFSTSNSQHLMQQLYKTDCEDLKLNNLHDSCIRLTAESYIALSADSCIRLSVESCIGLSVDSCIRLNVDSCIG